MGSGFQKRLITKIGKHDREERRLSAADAPTRVPIVMRGPNGKTAKCARCPAVKARTAMRVVRDRDGATVHVCRKCFAETA